MEKAEFDEIYEKIIKGIQLSHERLVEKLKKEDGELVVEKDGKIVVVKARDLPEDIHKIKTT